MILSKGATKVLPIKQDYKPFKKTKRFLFKVFFTLKGVLDEVTAIIKL